LQNRYYDEIGLGVLTFTARDLQPKPKKRIALGKAKAFDGSAPIGWGICSKSLFSNPPILILELKINDDIQARKGKHQRPVLFSLIKHSLCPTICNLKSGRPGFIQEHLEGGPVKLGDKLKRLYQNELFLEFGEVSTVLLKCHSKRSHDEKSREFFFNYSFF